MEPLNYAAQLDQPSFGDSLTKGIQTGLAIRQANFVQDQQQLALQAAQQQQERQQTMFNDLQSLAANPNASSKDYISLVTKYPDFAEKLKGPMAQLSANEQQQRFDIGAKALSAIKSGRPDVAADLFRQGAVAHQNSGDTNSAKGYAQWADAIDKDPNAAGTMAATFLAAQDPQKFAETYAKLGAENRAQAEAPSELQAKQLGVQKAAADIDNVKSQTAERMANMGLNRDKFNLDFDKTLQELKMKQQEQGAGGIKLSSGMETMQAGSIGTSVAATQAANQAALLADAFQREDPVGGWRGFAAEKIKSIAGFENGVSDIRRQFVSLRNTGMLAQLPPGSASDKDIQNIKAGFPTDTASSRQIADWLTSFSNVQKAVALRDELKADWIGSVGSMNKANKDIEVGGVTVPAGTSFADFLRRGATGAQRIVDQTTPATSQPRYLQYGK